MSPIIGAIIVIFQPVVIIFLIDVVKISLAVVVIIFLTVVGIVLAVVIIFLAAVVVIIFLAIIVVFVNIVQGAKLLSREMAVGIGEKPLQLYVVNAVALATYTGFYLTLEKGLVPLSTLSRS